MKPPSRETLHAVLKADRRMADERERHRLEMRQADRRAEEILATADERAKSIERAERQYQHEQDNKFRQQLTDERADYLTREEYRVQHQTLVDQLSVLNSFMAAQQGGKSNSVDVRTLLLGLGAIVVSASAIGVAFIIH
jgi:hypothetical protein